MRLMNKLFQRQFAEQSILWIWQNLYDIFETNSTNYPKTSDVNDKSGIQHGNLPRETKISQSYPSI